MRERSEMKAVLKALDAAQKEFPAIVKNKTARMPNYSYDYADLEGVVKGVTPTLRKHGLMFYQTGSIANDRQILVTHIVHLESGEEITSDFILPNCSDPQDSGSAITFFRRYALCSALGIITEGDADGQVKPKGGAKAPLVDDIPQFTPPPQQQAKVSSTGISGFICPYGNLKGKTFLEVGKPALATQRTYWNAKLKEPPKGKLKEYLDAINQYLGE
jgi:hypothetical protein